MNDEEILTKSGDKEIAINSGSIIIFFKQINNSQIVIDTWKLKQNVF